MTSLLVVSMTVSYIGGRVAEVGVVLIGPDVILSHFFLIKHTKMLVIRAVITEDTRAIFTPLTEALHRETKQSTIY